MFMKVETNEFGKTVEAREIAGETKLIVQLKGEKEVIIEPVDLDVLNFLAGQIEK